MWNTEVHYTRVKLCEFESLDAAYEASLLGADALGFHIFNEHTDRSGRPPRFAEIVRFLPREVSKTLLTDVPFDELVDVLAAVPFDSIQLYPDWPAEEILRLRTKVGRPLRILKVMSAQSAENEPANDEAFLARYTNAVDAILLDSYRIGGTGKVADWDHCRRIVESSALPVFLAGGLNKDNVERAIATVRPFGVDVENGVGDWIPNGPLVKNLRKCREFVDAVAHADRRHLQTRARRP